MRSRSYPGFSIGILLSVKVILPVNSVFIPLLNEIHRSMEREGERDMTKKRESNSLSLPLSLFLSLPLSLFLSLSIPRPPVRSPLGHTIANENTAWDKQLLSDWSK